MLRGGCEVESILAMRCCYKCGTEWDSEKNHPGAKECCDECSAYLHSCRNCRFHDPRAHNQCSILNSEWVHSKDGPNFCGDFEFVLGKRERRDTGARKKARAGFDALFGEEGQVDDVDEQAEIKRLFGD